MQYRRLGRTDLQVSVICLGTMTWGRQNTEAEAHEQMDYALEQGINFFDTAEMYAVPPTAETYGKTETYIGTWFKARGNRDKVILATKIVGPSANFGYVRGGKTRFTAEHLKAAVDASLQRLQTDYIDLYQLHWPDRNANYFGQRGFVHRQDERITPPAETLAALQDLIKAGKIRHVGLSNETPWGTMTFVRASESQGLPRMASVQNPYNLLNRSYESGLAEISIREDIGLLAYSPLGGGTLTGKYLNGQIPPGSRRSLDGRPSRYTTPNADAATQAYMTIAQNHGLDPSQMALSFVNRQPFVTANIIGATSMEQLRTDIASIDLDLSDDVLADIEATHRTHPDPCP